MLTGFNATDLKRWVEENRHLFNPPYKTNRVLAHHREFIVMVLNGPNARLDFHREPGEPGVVSRKRLPCSSPAPAPWP